MPELDTDGLLSKMAGGPVLPTQKQFTLSPKRRRWYVGPVGCAKTSTLVMSAIMPGLLYPGSEWLVARWRYWTLEHTTLKRFLEVCKRFGPNIFYQEPKVGPPFEIWLNTGVDERGQKLPPSHYIFNGLDDLDKLGSIEFSGVCVDEVNEIDFAMASTLDERLRKRLPEQERLGLAAEGPFFWIAASNPPNRSHWLHKKFCGDDDSDPEPWGTKFSPQKRENEKNLPPGYYETISQGKSPAMILRMVEGLCGPNPMGMAVFKDEFHEKLHVADLKPQSGIPMGRSWDFGRRRPCVTWFQRRGNYIDRYLCELGENIGLEKFADRILMMSSQIFPGFSWFDVCDPHGEAKRDNSDYSSCDILRKKGLKPKSRDVNIKMGIEQMSKGLATMHGDRPMSMYDRVGCQLIIEGYTSGYTWPEERAGRAVKEKPVADGYYEHPMDTDRYIMVNLLLGSKDRDGAPPRSNLRKARSSYTGY